MHAYGIPRVSELNGHPDCVDSQKFAVKTSAARVDSRSNMRSCNKRATRRIWKKKERATAKKEIIAEMRELA